jgi:two-component system, OmpR family, sensor kinase
VSLRWRLTLTLTLALLVVALGLGAVLYFLAAQEARGAFHLGLQTLTREYARLALEADAVQLREPPPSPFLARLGELRVWLLEPNGAVRDAVGGSDAPPRLSERLWAGLERGEETALDLEGRGVAAYPIFDAGTFRLSYTLVISADDVAGAQGLTRLRGVILGWVFGAALLALSVGNALALWLSRPLQRIAQTARAVGQGDLTRRIADAGARDEIGALQRDLNAMLERLEGLVGAHRRFTADAAHDLRTPIAVLRTELEVALRREREPELYRAALERVLGRVEGLSQLADDLLMLSRLEAGPERAFESFLLRDALEATLEISATLAGDRHLRFEVDVPLSLEVRGDAVLVARLVANLLGNAVKFARSAFGVRGVIVGREVRLEVWDDGPGVPLALRPTVFEAFSKGERSSGTGLGLAIARQIARAHGATLRLEDRSGAVFSVSLPRGGSNLRLTLTD